MNIKQSQLQYRHFVTGCTIAEMKEALRTSVTDNIPAVPNKRPRLMFVFTGQGAFWSQMGTVLIETFPVARNTLTKLGAHLQYLQVGGKWSLIGVDALDLLKGTALMNCSRGSPA